MPSRVGSRRQFALLAKPTAKGHSGPLRVSFVASTSDDAPVSVAYAISRQVGNAVVRNRIRRRLRALFDDLDPQPAPGIYLVKCGYETGRLPYAELQQHLHEALVRANVIV